MSDERPYCADGAHKYQESYYGLQCTRCPDFIPSVADEQEDYDDDDEPYEDQGFGLDECGLQEDGSCSLAGTEDCDWECPFRG
jgi:hypothetical protein